MHLDEVVLSVQWSDHVQGPEFQSSDCHAERVAEWMVRVKWCRASGQEPSRCVHGYEPVSACNFFFFFFPSRRRSSGNAVHCG